MKKVAVAMAIGAALLSEVAGAEELEYKDMWTGKPQYERLPSCATPEILVEYLQAIAGRSLSDIQAIGDAYLAKQACKFWSAQAYYGLKRRKVIDGVEIVCLRIQADYKNGPGAFTRPGGRWATDDNCWWTVASLVEKLQSR